MNSGLVKVPFHCLVISLLLMRTSFHLLLFLFLHWIPLLVVIGCSGAEMSGNTRLSGAAQAQCCLQEQRDPRARVGFGSSAFSQPELGVWAVSAEEQ